MPNIEMDTEALKGENRSTADVSAIEMPMRR
jgi:DNA-binding protein